MFNPTMNDITGTLMPHGLQADGWCPTSVTRVNFEGRSTSDAVSIKEGQVVYNLSPKQIITFHLR
jgi:hypothetical protein